MTHPEPKMSAKVTQGELKYRDNYACPGTLRGGYLELEARPSVVIADVRSRTVGSQEECDANGALLAASWNAITRAAARLGVDPLELARADVFAEVVECLQVLEMHVTNMPLTHEQLCNGICEYGACEGTHLHGQVMGRARAALSKLPSKEGR